MQTNLTICKTETTLPKFDETKEQAIIARRKSTKANEVPEADKFRAVILPRFELPADAAFEPFAELVRGALTEQAVKTLRDFCIATPDADSVDAGKFAIPSLLADFAASSAAERLSKETIAAWYAVSQTCKDAQARYSEGPDGKKVLALGNFYGLLASNNPGIQAAMLEKMLAYLAASDAETSSVATKIAERLVRMQERNNVAADDL